MEATLDYRNIDKKASSDGKFPAPIDGEYRIHFSESAHENMVKHASMTTEVELCGVLVGEVKKDSMGYFLLIHHVIEGKDSNNYGAQVTFTQKTWEHINPIMDKQYPNYRIVGWYHTHPGFGIFLSKMDMFIQENFFNLPFQVAVVLETKKNEIGCFVWSNGNSIPIQRYWVGNSEKRLSQGHVEEFRDPGQAVNAGMAPRAQGAQSLPLLDFGEPRGGGGGGGFGAFNFVFLVFFMVAGVMLGRMWAGMEFRQITLETIQSEIYGVLEFAGVGALASHDFGEIRKQTAAVDQLIAKNDMAGASAALKDLDARILEYEKSYAKSRRTFRRDLEKALTTKQSLGERVVIAEQRQQGLEEVLARMLVMRLTDSLQKDGAPIELEKLSEAAQIKLKADIEALVRTVPDSKEAILRAHPKVLEYFFPEKKDEAKKDAPKDTAK